MVPVFLGITVIIFLLLHAAPGDPADLLSGERAPQEVKELIKQRWGLDRPLPVQYWFFLTGLLRGDLGTSILYNRPVAEMLVTALPVTIELGIFAICLSAFFGIIIGIVSAVTQGSWIDQGSLLLALLGISMPHFWLGLILMYAFAVHWQIFPSTGYGSLSHLVLPGIALTLGGIALIARLTRSSMLEVISQDYVRTARAKGLAERAVIYRHALKNALLPVVTVLGLRLGFMIAGATVIEMVFSRPGMGRLMVQGILTRDYPVVQGAMVFLSITVLAANLVADLLYAVLDPRIQYR